MAQDELVQSVEVGDTLKEMVMTLLFLVLERDLMSLVDILKIYGGIDGESTCCVGSVADIKYNLMVVRRSQKGQGLPTHRLSQC